MKPFPPRAVRVVAFASLALGVTAAPCPLARAQPPVGTAAQPAAGKPMPLRIQPEKPHYSGGEPVTLMLTATNPYAESITLYRDKIGPNFAFEVERITKGPNGGTVREKCALTAYGKWLHQPRDFAKGEFVPLASAESDAQRVVLSRIFDMTLNGTYEIRARQYATLGERFRGGDQVALAALPVTVEVR